MCKLRLKASIKVLARKLTSPFTSSFTLLVCWLLHRRLEKDLQTLHPSSPLPASTLPIGGRGKSLHAANLHAKQIDGFNSCHLTTTGFYGPCIIGQIHTEMPAATQYQHENTELLKTCYHFTPRKTAKSMNPSMLSATQNFLSPAWMHRQDRHSWWQYPYGPKTEW